MTSLPCPEREKLEKNKGKINIAALKGRTGSSEELKNIILKDACQKS